MDVTIRPGRREDVPQVHALVRELAEFEKAPDAVTNTVEQMTADGFGPAPAYRLQVAEAKRRIVGMALFFVKYSTWKGRGLYLDDIVVREPFRRQGIGKKLFDAVLAIAAKEDMKTMHWQVLDWNTPAIEFYKRYNCSFEDGWVDCKLTDEQILAV